MRIRRSASRLLGGAAAALAPAPAPSDPPRFELSPPPPPPAATDQAHESSAGLVAPEASSCVEPCCVLSMSPWDLMDQFDLADPEVEERFEKTYFRTTRRASWLFPSSICMPNGSIKEKTTVDMVDGAINMAAKTTKGKKNESKSKTNKGIKVKKGLWTCNKGDGKKPPMKRPVVDMGEAFYYYAGFGPSCNSKRHCRSSGGSSVLEEPPLPIEQQKDGRMPTLSTLQIKRHRSRSLGSMGECQHCHLRQGEKQRRRTWLQWQTIARHYDDEELVQEEVEEAC
ncbi:hypothetical protein CFC21_054387 [Triticum aestivum]|uniref:Uncharacterized protein n=2 Tax=Triticum aestivum TaxID=4565 RepID=A0A9R1K8X7_WHEAT|nr:uncharacterized protein LOC123082794 [Triticum aestivum]KAF7045265.1 hypothetical protein CFC21_054387 [Triticum aestivum]